MKPSAAVRQNIARYPVRNARLFGSSARGDDRSGRDVDILVDPEPQTTLYDLAELEMELEALLGCKLDVRTPGDLAPEVANRIAADLRPM
jgi:predicted nucleotidyltransferase